MTWQPQGLKFFATRRASKRSSTAPGTCIIGSSPEIAYPFILEDIQKSEYSSIANFSRLFNEILVHYQKLLGSQGKEPEFVGIGKHPTLRASRDDIQISRITCKAFGWSDDVIEDLPDVPPAISLIASEMALGDDPDTFRKKIVSILPDLRIQSERFIETQNARESDHDPGNRFEVHLHGAIDPLSGNGCVALPCRMAAAERISRSVGLIADRVWLTDRFSERILACEDATPEAIDDLVYDFFVVVQLLPLISAGVIRFRSPWIPSCENCIDYFDRQVDKISQRVAEAFASEFSLKREPFQHPYVEIGNAVVPSMVQMFLEKNLDKLPSIEEYTKYWVRDQVNSALWVSREASLTNGAVVSNSRAALAGLLQADGRLIDRGSLKLLEDERSFTVPWVSRLNAAQVVELREEAAGALPRFREKMASAMAFDGLEQKGRSEGKDLILELREQAEEVRSELAIVQKSSARFWKTTYGLLGLGLSAYGVSTDHLVAGVGGLLPLIQLLISHKSGEEKETLTHKSRPGYVLIKAQDILAHSEDHVHRA